MFASKPPGTLPDCARARHPGWRRHTRRYRIKRRIVREIWLWSGAVMIFLPLGALLTLALATTFLSFAVLDETA